MDTISHCDLMYADTEMNELDNSTNETFELHGKTSLFSFINLHFYLLKFFLLKKNKIKN